MPRITEITSNYRTKLIISAYKRWLSSGDRILDIGCGTGIVAKALMQYFPIKLTACDIKNYLFYKLPFIKIEGGKIPVKDNAYDVALLNDVLHHIRKEKQKEVLIEAIRVAKKVLVFEAKPTIIGKLTDIILNKYHYGDLKTPISFRTVPDWLNLFKDLGLKADVVKINKPFWYPFSHIAFLVTKK